MKKRACIGVIVLMLVCILIPTGRVTASTAAVPLLSVVLPGDGEEPEDETTKPEDGLPLPNVDVAPEETVIPEIELPGDIQTPDKGETPAPEGGEMPDETQTPEDGEMPDETPAPEDGIVSEGAVSGDSITASAKESGTSIPLWLILTVSGVVVVLIVVIIILACKNKKIREKTVSPAGAQSMPQESQNMQAGGNFGIAMKFEVLYGDCKHKEMRLSLEDTLTIGSDAGCDIVFQNPDVSPVNSRIVLRNGMIYIEDMDSVLGTAIGGMRIQGSNRLRSGDLVSIGEVEFTVKF